MPTRLPASGVLAHPEIRIDFDTRRDGICPAESGRISKTPPRSNAVATPVPTQHPKHPCPRSPPSASRRHGLLAGWQRRACSNSRPTGTPSQFPFGPRRRSFESKIRPLLIDRCVDCHGPEKQKGGLRLGFRRGLPQGRRTRARGRARQTRTKAGSSPGSAAPIPTSRCRPRSRSLRPK
jgi:hypothetical protein